MKQRFSKFLMSMAVLAVSTVPSMAQETWDFVYDGSQLPQTIVDRGGPGWAARSGEILGRPIYEKVIYEGAQEGGIWSRIDDNGADPNFPTANNWARGYLFGTNAYSQWNGRMTLVMRIKDLGTDSEKSVVDINNSAGNYFTLGHTTENVGGAAGWEWGQTNDGRNAKGLSDVRTGGFNEWTIVRLVIIDDVPGDGKSLVRGYQNGMLVYESERQDSIGAGEFGEIAFRRTSGGNQQKMLIDWIYLDVGNAWAPGEGAATPTGFSDSGWDFVYDGAQIPQTIVDTGGVGWTPRTGEITGRPIYEKALFNHEAQVGGIWSRIDDNGADPDFPTASNWARGYVVGNHLYNQWNGHMTLVMRIKDVGTDSEKSVIDITTSTGNYFTLGHAAANAGGVAGWEWGQTNDTRNANGLSDVRTGGFNEWVILRLVVIDDVPGDGKSIVRGYQNGQLVYESERSDSISLGEFGEIAFRRTSGGNQQKMMIDWILMDIGNAWAPGEGALTPAGLQDTGGTTNFAQTGDINGAISLDTYGVIRTVHGSSISPALNPLFAVDANGVPTQFNIFYLGFDVFRDLETVATDQDNLSGVVALDKFSGVHTMTFNTQGSIVTGPSIISGPGQGPRVNYQEDVVRYNAANPAAPVFLPYFPFELPIANSLGGVARDLELAVDWRSATNAFQGYYIMDSYAGIHYINNAEILVMLNEDTSTAPNQFYSPSETLFYSIFGFRPKYSMDYAGLDNSGFPKFTTAPYFLSPTSGFPIARDLEVIVRFDAVTPDYVTQSQTRSDLAVTSGVDINTLYQPISVSDNRLDVSQSVFTSAVAVTNGYAILDGFGVVHSLVEDQNGVAIPAPWESVETGGMDPSTNAPYFPGYDIAVDVEIMPNGGGFVLLNKLGDVFVVNAKGRTAEDNFVDPNIVLDLPQFGFDAARDLRLVADASGKIAGMYVVDRFGTVHRAGNVPAIPGEVLYFQTGNALDLQLSPYQRPITAAQ